MNLFAQLLVWVLITSHMNDLPVVDQAMPTLIINDVTEDDTGDYVCFVRNPYGDIGQSGVARLILGK